MRCGNFHDFESSVGIVEIQLSRRNCQHGNHALLHNLHHDGFRTAQHRDRAVASLRIVAQADGHFDPAGSRIGRNGDPCVALLHGPYTALRLHAKPLRTAFSLEDKSFGRFHGNRGGGYGIVVAAREETGRQKQTGENSK